MPISEVFNEDCMIGMARYPDKFFDLAVPDPPYGIDGNSHRKNKSRGRIARSKDYHMALWDQPKPDDNFFELLFRKSEHQLIFGGNYFGQLGITFKTPRRHEINDFLKEYPTGWIAWDKCNNTTGFNDYELIWTSFKDMPSSIYKFMWNGFQQGLSIERGHIMNPIKKYNEVRIHPAHKPLALYKYLYRKFSQYTSNILDTHLGGQSSRIAAWQMGIDFYGMEKVKQYYDEGNKRFKEQTAQLKLL